MAKQIRAKSRSSSLAFTALALFAIFICIRLGFWQFERYEIRHELTAKISSALSKEATELTSSSQENVETWMRILIKGSYDPRYQLQFRGHYFQERYGLEILSLFIPENTDIPPIWVDRGWMPAGNSAKEVVAIPAPPNGSLIIRGVLRQYDDPNTRSGVFFALPAPRIGRIDELTLQKSFSGETFHKYLKLDSGSDGSPLATQPLTPPGEGPHLAYAIQWWIFALLIAGTRIALFKGERSPGAQSEN